MEQKIVISDLDIIGVVNLLERRQRKYCAIMLSEIEEIMGVTDDYKLVRKIVLDKVNDLKRAILHDIFSGDVEDSRFIG